MEHKDRSIYEEEFWSVSGSVEDGDVAAFVKRVEEYFFKFYELSGNTPSARYFASACVAAHSTKAANTGSVLEFNLLILPNDTDEEIRSKLKQFQVQVLADIRQHRAQHPCTDILRTKDGKAIRDPFPLWDKLLETYSFFLANGGTMAKLAMAKELGYWSPTRDGEAEVENQNPDTNALVKMQRHLDAATELIRRAEIGTFPYDEKGEYRLI